MTQSMPMVVFDSIAQSNIPRHEKSAIARWVDNVTGGVLSAYAGFPKSGDTGENVGVVDVIKADGEGAMVGGLLGALNAQFGLDMFGKKVPSDLVLSVLTGVGSVGRSSTDLRNISVSAMSVFAFRKTDALVRALSQSTATAGATVAGEPAIGGEDPIAVAARNL